MNFLNGCYVIYDSINRITQPYISGSHYGIDLGYRQDENMNKVYSAGYGVVEQIQDGLDNDITATGIYSWGNYVLINHQNGFKTRYAHLEKNLPVSVGQEVDATTLIGIIGNTGYSFGRHLHFEVINSNGVRINGIEYLKNTCINDRLIPKTTTKKKSFPWFIYNQKLNEMRENRN